MGKQINDNFASVFPSTQISSSIIKELKYSFIIFNTDPSDKLVMHWRSTLNIYIKEPLILLFFWCGWPKKLYRLKQSAKKMS